ncbi:ABC transporter ATP-binding protein [Paraburkholderia azotifigens]|uniref:ABC transporter ATP-binding protein n=1 Tax=Paraburkholderia azotifigens TaxID=2057004 RepID=UPI0038BE0269
MSALLQAIGLSKHFGGVYAIRNVSLSISAGKITGILGPNGAGKTTLFDLLTGFLPADRGEVRLGDTLLTGKRADRIVNLGCARTFQLCRPFTGMSVVQNVMVGCLAPRVRDLKTTHARALHLLEEVGLGDKASLPAHALSQGDLRRLEIARALGTKPLLLLLDEPFSGLGANEAETLSALIRQLNRDEGITVLMIEHRLRDLMLLAEHLLVMDSGKVIADGEPEAVMREPSVVAACIGTRENGHAAARDTEP